MHTHTQTYILPLSLSLPLQLASYFSPSTSIHACSHPPTRTSRIYTSGNLRATGDNPSYKQLVNYWIDNSYTLRYSGGLVPDVYHILTKVVIVLSMGLCVFINVCIGVFLYIYIYMLNTCITKTYTPLSFFSPSPLAPTLQTSHTQGEGVISNASSRKAKAKLRLLFEAAPIALIVEAAGGMSCVCATENLEMIGRRCYRLLE